MDINQAVINFYEPENLRAFMLCIMNGAVTPFIETLSKINQKEPYDNARELSVMAHEYINTSYSTLKYFGVNEGNTLGKFLHKNNKSTRRTVNYLFAELESKLTQEEFYYLIRELLAFYMSPAHIIQEVN